jgi:hypothetical protein
MTDIRRVRPADRTVGELLGALTEDLTLLLRQEVALGKAEMRQTMSQAVRDLIALIAGGAVAAGGGVVLLFAAVLGLTALTGIALWLSALIVGGVVALAGLGLVAGGLNGMRQVKPAPRTIASVKNDIEWAKEQIR